MLPSNARYTGRVWYDWPTAPGNSRRHSPLSATASIVAPPALVAGSCRARRFWDALVSRSRTEPSVHVLYESPTLLGRNLARLWVSRQPSLQHWQVSQAFAVLRGAAGTAHASTPGSLVRGNSRYAIRRAHSSCLAGGSSGSGPCNADLSDGLPLRLSRRLMPMPDIYHRPHQDDRGQTVEYPDPERSTRCGR